MYRLEFSIKENGSSEINPDIDAEDVNNRKDYFDNNIYDTFIQPEPFFNDLKFFKSVTEENEPTILNDAHGWAGQYPYMGWHFPVSERLKDILEDHQLVRSRFYPGSLNFQGKAYNYFVFHTLRNGWEYVINFQQSIFTEWKSTGSGIVDLNQIKISSLVEFNIESKKMRNESKEKYGIRHTIGPKEIHFSQEVDLIFLPVIRYVVSERLKQAVEKANISGLEFIPITDVDFYYQGEKL